MDIRQALAFEYARVLSVARAADGLFIFLAAYLMCRHMMYFAPETPSEINATRAVGLAIVSFQLSFIIALAKASRYAVTGKLLSSFSTVASTSALTAAGVLTAVFTPSLIAAWCAMVFVTAISTSKFLRFDIGIGLVSAVVSCVMTSLLTNQIVFPEGIIVGASASHIVAHRIVEYLGGHLAVDLSYKSHRNINFQERRILVFPRGRGALIDVVTGLACGLASGPLFWFFHGLFNAALLLIPRPYPSAVLYLMAGFSGCLCCGIMTFLSADAESGDEDVNYDTGMRVDGSSGRRIIM